MTWLLGCSITALLVKLALFFHHDVRHKPFLLCFVSGFFLLNLLELSTFFRLGVDELSLRLYYGVAVFCAFYLLLLSTSVSQSLLWLNSRIALGAVLAFAALIGVSDWILLGAKPLENGSITRIAGDYYFVYQIYMFGALLLTPSLLIRRLLQADDYYHKARCIVTLLSFMPSILVIIVVMVAMQLGYRINVVGILSLTNCFMLLTFIPLSGKKALFFTMKSVPFTREWNNDRKMFRLAAQCYYYPAMGIRIDLEAILGEIEAIVIENASIYQSQETKES